ncbi:hypothetical protein BMS96_07470 [Leuconostoc lactis]|nr:hypothetical protein BMS94_07475 [Leuconostoc lactis]ORI85961.1 hypothetical protein BMS96_07470 [Leuconostoc lactis]
MNCVTHTFSTKGFFTPSKLVMKLNLSLFYTPQKNDAQYRSLSKAMKKARRTIRKHFDEIINSFIYGFSNGPIEGSNNKIKAIKRTEYGFRSFKNFRLRILISFKNSFYSMNYKQKAADLNNVKSAA